MGTGAAPERDESGTDWFHEDALCSFEGGDGQAGRRDDASDGSFWGDLLLGGGKGDGSVPFARADLVGTLGEMKKLVWLEADEGL